MGGPSSLSCTWARRNGKGKKIYLKKPHRQREKRSGTNGAGNKEVKFGETKDEYRGPVVFEEGTQKYGNKTGE